MGGACSRRPGKVDTGDALSFSDMIGAGDGAFPPHGGKGAKSTYNSVEIKITSSKAGASKVPEVSSLLGRAGTVGLGKAVEILDSLGSSMSRLNSGSGLLSGMMHRGNKISILAFEVANTIAKGATIMISLSEKNIQLMRKDILQSNGIQQLVSTDFQELLSIAALDKRVEFDVFSKEVVRFGDLCKDPQWHNLARYFQKLEFDPTPRQQLKEEAETSMQHLVDLAQLTSELYHELQALDRFELDFQRKLKEEESMPTAQPGENLKIMHGELKNQRKLVKSLKKKSLWSRNLEEVVEKLVDVVTFLHKEILEAFGHTGVNMTNSKSDHGPERLGVLGLALHYANIINQIDNVFMCMQVSRPSSLPPNTRDTLYHGLPATVKAALCSRLQTSHLKEELTIALIKSEMQKILQWLAPMADNTIKTHQGFGWVGEWANMSTELNRRPAHYSVIRIQTLYHADKEKTEEYILQLVVWLHHLVSQVKSRCYGFRSLKSVPYPSQKNMVLSVNTRQDLSLPCNVRKSFMIQLSEEDRKMLESVSTERLVLRRSKSQGCITKKEKKGRRRWARSSSNSPSRELTTGLDFVVERTKVVDVINGLETLGSPPPISSFCA